MLHRVALCAALCLAAGIAAAGPVTVYVAPDGKDSWSGHLARPNRARTDGPAASLLGARNALRKLRTDSGAAARVVIAGGRYQVREPIILEPRDGGTDDARVVYAAAPGSKPVFDGGFRIGGWKPAPGGLWQAPVPGGARFEQLYVNGVRATRARTPNAFYHYMAGKLEYGIDPVTGTEAQLGGRAFIARPEDLKPLLSVPKDDLANVVVMAYHSWETSRHRIAAVDGATPPRELPRCPR
ncbi:MAG: hypothetical protein NT029_18890 [Armatimonadetes bacterium]|nr:hypothetical protein [Armatimonadota bacterium]